MKLDLVIALTQSLKYYVEKEISGTEFSRLIAQSVNACEDLDKKQTVTFKYYISFFKGEGKDLYLESNVYLKGEVDELSQFLDNLAS